MLLGPRDKGCRQLMYPRTSLRKVRLLEQGAQGQRGLICPLMRLRVVPLVEVDAPGQRDLICLPISSPPLKALAPVGRGLPRITRPVVVQAVWFLRAPGHLRKRRYLAVVSARVWVQHPQEVVLAQVGVVVVVGGLVVALVTLVRQRRGKTRPEPRRRRNPRRPQGLAEHRAVARSGSKVGVKVREA